MLAELKRQGQNLNQLTTIANTAGTLQTELKETLSEHIRTYRNLEKLVNEV